MDYRVERTRLLSATAASWSAGEDTGGRGPAAATISPNVIVSGGEALVAWNGTVYSELNGCDTTTVVARSDP